MTQLSHTIWLDDQGIIQTPDSGTPRERTIVSQLVTRKPIITPDEDGRLVIIRERMLEYYKMNGVDHPLHHRRDYEELSENLLVKIGFRVGSYIFSEVLNVKTGKALLYTSISIHRTAESLWEGEIVYIQMDRKEPDESILEVPLLKQPIVVRGFYTI